MRLFKTVLLLFFSQLVFAQAKIPQLSDRAFVSSITIDPGSEVYSIFGHSAYRVADPRLGLDRIYNYGTFDFDDTFVFKFARGKLNYKLSIEDFSRFEYKYHYFNRSYKEQVLDLNQAQVQKVFEFLETNHLPENRYYLYDFFYDNCATRMVDVVEQSLADEVTFDRTPPAYEVSFREMIDNYVEEKAPWLDLGIDMALGLPADKIMTNRDYTFLPDYVYKDLEKATLEGGKPLVRSSKQLFEALPEESGSLPHPNLIFWSIFLLIAVATVIGFRKGKRKRWIDFTLFLIGGIAGLVIVFLWFFTDHTTTINNLNILWATPFHLVAAFFAFKKQLSNFWKKYFLVIGGLNSLIIVLWGVLPQDLPSPMIPMILALTMRAFYIYYSQRD